MSQLPAWWLAQLAEARQGLETGAGPFWSGRFLCGQPLFGAPELPFTGPGAAMALLAPAAWLWLHALVLMLGLALWLRRSSVGIGAATAGAVAGLLVAGMLLHPEAAALLGSWAWLPWAVLLSVSSPGWVAAPFCALHLLGASPLLILLALGFSFTASRERRTWALAWALGAAMAAPGFLELLRLAPSSAAVHDPGWPLAWAASPLVFFHSCLLLLFAFAVLNGWVGRRPGLLLGLLAGAAAMGAAFLLPVPRNQPPATEAAFLRGVNRRQAVAAQMPRSLAALQADRWTGALGGLAPRASLERWQGMGVPGVEGESTLSLANVGWVDAVGASTGSRWFRPVAAATLDGVVALEGPHWKPREPIFERALGVGGAVQEQRVSGWRTQALESPGPNAREVALNGQGEGSWAFLSESYDRGWKATVWDRQGAQHKVAVRPTEGGFLAAPVGALDAKIVWQYRPIAAGAGLILAIIGFMGMFIARQRTQRR